MKTRVQLTENKHLTLKVNLRVKCCLTVFCRQVIVLFFCLYTLSAQWASKTGHAELLSWSR